MNCNPLPAPIRSPASWQASRLKWVILAKASSRLILGLIQALSVNQPSLLEQAEHEANRYSRYDPGNYWILVSYICFCCRSAIWIIQKRGCSRRVNGNRSPLASTWPTYCLCTLCHVSHSPAVYVSSCDERIQFPSSSSNQASSYQWYVCRSRAWRPCSRIDSTTCQSIPHTSSCSRSVSRCRSATQYIGLLP